MAIDYSRFAGMLDPEAEQALTGQVSTTNSRGTTTTSNQVANTTPLKSDVKAAQKLTRAQDAGYDLTQAANASAGTAQTMGSSLSPVVNSLSGAGGRSRYTDEEIAFMTGGGVTTPPPTGTEPPTRTRPEPDQPDQPVTPVAPETAVDPAAGQFADYTEQEIDAALRGIEAEFGMTREQLLQDKSMIGAQYRLLMARLNRARTQGLASATNDAVSRGLYRSGILGENLANVEQQFSEEEMANRQQQQIQEQGIERQLAFLDQGQAAAQAQAQNQILGQATATMAQAGLNPAQAGFAPAATGAPGVAAAPTGVIPRAPMGPGDIMPEPNAQVAANPYAGFPVVGGYYIDPQTGLAVARVDGR